MASWTQSLDVTTRTHGPIRSALSRYMSGYSPIKCTLSSHVWLLARCRPWCLFLFCFHYSIVFTLWSPSSPSCNWKKTANIDTSSIVDNAYKIWSGKIAMTCKILRSARSNLNINILHNVMFVSSPVIPINRQGTHRHCIASITLERLCQIKPFRKRMKEGIPWGNIC